MFRSAILEKLWPFGFSCLGAVTFESAAYVARYVMKKWSKDNLQGEALRRAMIALDKWREDPYNEELRKAAHSLELPDMYEHRRPEYITMSRKPGIGSAWYDQFKGDVYPGGFCVVNGKKVKPPKFYDSRLSLTARLSLIR